MNTRLAWRNFKGITSEGQHEHFEGHRRGLPGLYTLERTISVRSTQLVRRGLVYNLP